MTGQRHGLADAKRTFAFPVTPSADASLMALTTHESHRYAGDHLIVGFEADPAVVREYVPEPLEVDDSGLVFLWSAHNYLYTSEPGLVRQPLAQRVPGVVLLDPGLVRGRDVLLHALLVVQPRLAVAAGARERDAAQAGLGADDPLRPTGHEVLGPARGVRLNVLVENHGTVLRASCTLDRQISREELPFRVSDDYCPRFVGRRHHYDSARREVVIDDLCAHWGTEMALGEISTGPAELRFGEAENEEVLPFQPRRVLGGWWFDLAWAHSEPPTVIHDYLAS